MTPFYCKPIILSYFKKAYFVTECAYLQNQIHT